MCRYILDTTYRLTFLSLWVNVTQFTILLVGYFILGPSDLYKVVKAIGQGITNLRQLGSDVTKTFENNMESQLQLEELRKAQRELSDAFSFRRSINVDADAEFNTVTLTNATTTTTATAESTTETTTTQAAPKRKKRKRVKKKMEEPEQTNVPDLEMPPLDDTLIREEEERERLRRERLERLEKAGMPQQQQPSESLEEQERFAQQLSGDWNEYILKNEKALSPLSKIMERLAILEEEKKAADARLEEEFRLRADVEERYYQQKRAILEEAATELQAEGYVSISSSSNTMDNEEKKRTS